MNVLPVTIHTSWFKCSKHTLAHSLWRARYCLQIQATLFTKSGQKETYHCATPKFHRLMTLNQVPSMNTIKHLVVTNRTQIHIHKLEKCVLVANSVWALTEPWRAVSCHPAPGHAFVIMTVILVIIRKRRSWNWGVNQHSGGNPNKTEEEQTGRRLMWTMGNPEGGQHWEKKTVWWEGGEGEGCHRASSMCFVVIIRAHASGSRFPLHLAQPINSV